MAELVASIIGIIGTGTTVTQALFQLANDLRSAGEEVQLLATEISIFCLVLEDLKSTLEKAQSSGFSLDSLKSMQAILDHCKLILKRIQQVLDKLMMPQNPQNTFLTSLSAKAKWIFSKSKVDNLRARLESSKLTLSVMMTGFNWALLLDQKEYAGPSLTVLGEVYGITRQSTARESEAERQRLLLQSLVLAQQFLVQRLEQIEGSCDGDASSDEDLIPEIYVSSNSELSRTLNGSIFHDGLTASDRQWTTRTEGERTAVLSTFAENLTASSSPGSNLSSNSMAKGEARVDKQQSTSSIRATIVFQPIPPEHRTYFDKEPRHSATGWIDIDVNDDKGSIKIKALEAFNIAYHPCHYDLHWFRGRHEYHIDSWSSREFQKAKDDACPQVGRGCELVLSIQNTLWEKCRDVKPQFKWWIPKAYVLRDQG